MLVREMMTRNPVLASPDESIRDAAKRMLELDSGVLPVHENDRLIGLITDRDIVTRVIAAGKSPDQCTVREAMSPGVKYIYDDENEDDVARNMATLQVRRLPVVDRNKRLVGIVSLADLAVRHDGPATWLAVRHVSQPHAH
jgi:CBS domain-containing protein